MSIEESTPSSCSTESKEIVLQNIYSIVSTHQFLTLTQLEDFLKQTIQCFGGSKQTTLCTAKLTRYLLERLRNNLDSDFVVDAGSKILRFLEVPDTEERYYVNCVLHSLYSNNIKIRSELRQLFGRSLLVHGSLTSAALLDTLYSIIQGFTVPLKDVHVDFCRIYLLPLLASDQLLMFYPNLRRCLAEYCSKTQVIVREIVSSLLLRCFDPRDPISEHIFGFSLELASRLTPEEYNTVEGLICQRLGEFINQPEENHVQVALAAFDEPTTCSRILSNPSLAQMLVLPALANAVLVQPDAIAAKCIKVLHLFLYANSRE